jgi:hypothetical protein
MIANSTLGGDAANIDFTSIPSHYAHLMLVCYLRGDTAAVTTNCNIRFNNDTAGNYDYQSVFGSAATASAAEAFAQAAAAIGTIPANSAGANLFDCITVEIAHYANSANNKASVSQWAMKYGTATTNMSAGTLAQFWRSNAAINRITLLPVAGSFRAGSRITLYGLAG